MKYSLKFDRYSKLFSGRYYCFDTLLEHLQLAKTEKIRFFQVEISWLKDKTRPPILRVARSALLLSESKTVQEAKEQEEARRQRYREERIREAAREKAKQKIAKRRARMLDLLTPELERVIRRMTQVAPKSSRPKNRSSLSKKQAPKE